MSASRPNIIFIITDQQRYDTIHALGFPYMDTPNLDRLAAEGVSFTHCHVTAPLCVPSRASLFTGLYPHTTGVLTNVDQWQHSWVERLADSGYHCVNIGKMHAMPYDGRLGFHERYVVENTDTFRVRHLHFDEWRKAIGTRGLVRPQRDLYRQWPDYRERLGAFEWTLPEETHSDMFIGDMARWWIEAREHVEPLFLQIGFPGPHPPYDPVLRYAERYLERELPLPEVTEDEIRALPPPYQAIRRSQAEHDIDSVVHLLNPTPEQLKRQRAYYLGNVTMIDEMIGQILDALERTGYLENAVVIFASDHGDCLGDHGLGHKGTMYDAVVRVPLIVRAPGRFPGGRRLDGLCQLMDVAPTIMDLARIETAPAKQDGPLHPELEEIEVPPPMEAESLMPALEGGAWDGRPHVFSEIGMGGSPEADFSTMVRDRDWKLVHFVGRDFGQLFNLVDDPTEVHNLWDDPSAAQRKRELLDILRDWRIRSGQRTKGWAAPWR